MLTFEILAVALLGSVVYVHGYFSWTTCTHAHSPVSVTNIEESPDPVNIPGGVTIAFDANTTANVTFGSLHIKMTKHFLFGSIPITCIMNIGSCTYDHVCNITDDMVNDNWAGVMVGVGSQLKAMLGGTGLGLDSCTQVAKSTHVGPVTLQIPTLPSILSIFADGKYEIHIQLMEAKNNSIVLCLDTHIKICSGLSCLFGGKK